MSRRAGRSHVDIWRPDTPRGVGGRHIMRRRISRAQQTQNWCVGFSFPPPAYAGIHLFGFRANALNSHSPPYLPGFDPGSGLGRFGVRDGGFRGPPGLGGLRELRKPFVVRMLGLVVGFAASVHNPLPGGS